MGHSEPWRAQFAIWSIVVSAYWITPWVPSWLGKGTSRRGRLEMLLMGGGGGGPPFMRPGLCISGWAGLEVVVDIRAREPVLCERTPIDGLAFWGRELLVSHR